MIPFAPPFIDDDVIREVNEALRSGWITTGPKTKEFEKKLALYCDIPAVLCLNSGTTALTAMLHWFGVTKGDEVIVPAYTYNSTAQSVMHCGASPVMVDVKDDFNIDPEQVKAAITEKTKCIIPVDIAGWPCDYDKLYEIVHDPAVKSYFKPATTNQEDLGRILVLSDAAHSIGGLYKGLRVGALADVTIFSFHAVKNLTTAEGGAIALNLPSPFENEAIYSMLNTLMLHGQSKDALAKQKAGGWRYDVTFPGYKGNMPDVLGAMGLAQYRKYDQLLVGRKRVFAEYFKQFSQCNWAELPPDVNEQKESAYHLFLLRVKGINEEQRDAMIEKIIEQEVNVNVHFIPLPELTLFKQMGFNMESYPKAYENYSREISLPVYPQLTNDQVKTVTDAVSAAYEGVTNETYN
jgi:dTDP-4-amino-4,6-dideoxygalactose transaminase